MFSFNPDLKDLKVKYVVKVWWVYALRWLNYASMLLQSQVHKMHSKVSPVIKLCKKVKGWHCAFQRCKMSLSIALQQNISTYWSKTQDIASIWTSWDWGIYISLFSMLFIALDLEGVNISRCISVTFCTQSDRSVKLCSKPFVLIRWSLP